MTALSQIVPRIAFRAFLVLMFVFLLLPIVAVVLGSFSATTPLSFPPRGFTTEWYGRISPSYYEAFKVSALVAIAAAGIATLVGVPAALAIVRGRFPGKALLGAFCLSPLMVSTLVIAIAAFQFTVIVWDLFGLALAGTIHGLILAQSAFTIPFVVRSVIAAQANYDISLEEAAQSLGAGPLETFFKVTLPILLPGIAAGAIFAFLMSFDDIAVALFVGGGAAQTLPVKIYTAVEFEFNSDILAVSSLIILASLALTLVADRLVGLDRVSGVARG
ncbi:ABC transporter permease [Zavarzinia sp. CC-PAN008]|uniref:ABC transporter permease n=1 Tax=Zavarzinia sp. CC-PAN008 TaxID=3243332 RepID=UPI003F74A9B6